jgi:VPDSG-CTERM motif
MKAVKKYSLCTLLAIGLALNANAGQDKGKQEKVKVVDSLPAPKPGKPYSVPDAGSTAALLGLCVALLVLAQRKAAMS